MAEPHPTQTTCQWCRAELQDPDPLRRYCGRNCINRAYRHRQACPTWPECDHPRLRVGRHRMTDRDRLMRSVDRSGGPDACWPWTGPRNARGYGQTHIYRDGRPVHTGAHRAVYQATLGDVPDGLFVLHGCHNPPCCNPAHLRPGTHLENMADRQNEGAGYARGSDHPHAIQISDETVAAIRAEYRPRVKDRGQHALAARYGLSRSQIQRIVTGTDRWRKFA
jgi:hypothetical protein